jgi:sugar lactone lactonase YvrE
VGQKIYWGYQSGELMRRNVDGSGDVEVLFTGLGAPDGIALDVAAGKIYFAANGNMMRANMDGTGTPEVLFPASASNIVLELDVFSDDFESGDSSRWTAEFQ